MALNHLFFTISLLLPLMSSLLVIASTTDGTGYVPRPYSETTKLENTMLGIQGMVYCKAASKSIPIEGAVVRISCDSVDNYGLEKAEDVSFLSGVTNKEGYYLATLSASEIESNKKLTKCKAFLELSSSDTCNVPTDENNGISGASFAYCRLLNNNKIKLCTIARPFYFTSSSEPNKTISNGY